MGKPQRSSKPLLIVQGFTQSWPGSIYSLGQVHWGLQGCIEGFCSHCSLKGKGEEREHWISGGKQSKAAQAKSQTIDAASNKWAQREDDVGKAIILLPGLMCYWKGHISTGLSPVSWHSQPLTWPGLSPWSKVLLLTLPQGKIQEITIVANSLH